MSTPGFLSFDVEMDKSFAKGLARAQDAVSDLRPALKSIAADFYRSQKSIFQLKSSGGYPDFKGPKISETWKSPGRPEMRTRDGSKTAAQYSKIKHFGFDYPLLKATGDLEESVTNPSGRGAIYKLDKQGLTIGTSISYAGFHQSDATRSKIPLRKFLFIGPESNTASNTQLQGRLPRWLNILNTYVLRSMGATADNAKGPKNG